MPIHMKWWCGHCIQMWEAIGQPAEEWLPFGSLSNCLWEYTCCPFCYWGSKKRKGERRPGKEYRISAKKHLTSHLCPLPCVPKFHLPSPSPPMKCLQHQLTSIARNLWARCLWSRCTLHFSFVLQSTRMWWKFSLLYKVLLCQNVVQFPGIIGAFVSQLSPH